MQVEFLMQKDKESSLLDNLISSFSNKPKKVYMFLGDLKEQGFKAIEEEFIDTKIKLYMAIGVNKKHTTRNMLDSILEYTKDAYFYTNNDLIEFDSNICIFEYTDEACIFVSPSSFSESGISENISVYTKITYNLKDSKEKDDYKKVVKDLTKKIEEVGFSCLDKAKIEELVENKEIFTTRQYTHTNVMSISELLGKSKTDEKSQEKTKIDSDDVINSEVAIPKVDLSDIDIDISDIDLSDVSENNIELEKATQEPSNEVEENKSENLDIESTIEDEFSDQDLEEVENDKIDKENDLYDESLEEMDFDENGVLDINSMLFSKADVKLDIDLKEKESSNTKKEEEEEIEDLSEDEVLQVKKLNLNNVSNVILELPSRPQKVVDQDKIKIQNSIQQVVPNFFELQNKNNSVIIDGVNYKQKNITIEVVNVKDGKKYSDRNAKLLQKKGQSYFVIESSCISNLLYEEKDIIRIIKLSDELFHLEIIPKDMQEYKLWSKLCNKQVKGSTRKYGLM